MQLGIVSQETGDKLAEWLFNAGVAAGEVVQNCRDGMATLVAIGSDVYSAVAWIFEGNHPMKNWKSAAAGWKSRMEQYRNQGKQEEERR